MQQTQQLQVAQDDDDRRLDRLLRKAFPRVPPGALARAVRTGAVRVNGHRKDNEHRVHTGDVVTVPVWQDTGKGEGRPPGDHRSHQRGSSRPANSRLRDSRYGDARQGSSRPGPPVTPPPRLAGDRIILDSGTVIPVLERTEDWIACSKPPGMVTHGPGGLDGIIRELAAQHRWWSESLSFRPGPVHRLDRQTSGVQLFSLTARGARELSEELASRRTCKLYVTVLTGTLTETLHADEHLSFDRTEGLARAHAAPSSRGSTARTTFVPLAVRGDKSATLVAALPETGRRHQIRAHAAAHGMPLRGDKRYGGKPGDAYLLHALALAMPERRWQWNAPLFPRDFGDLRREFGDGAPLSRRLTEVWAARCTQHIPGSTIKL